jgi:hypothetical protein
MSATAEARDIIERASREGLVIARGTAPNNLKLRGPAATVEKWAPLIARHKNDILTRLAANDARDLGEAQAERAAIREHDGGIDRDVAELLARHGGFSGVDWPGLSLIDAQESALWIVQRPDGLLTVLATVDPIPRPTSYRQAWAAKFLTPEPTDDEPEIF